MKQYVTKTTATRPGVTAPSQHPSPPNPSPRALMPVSCQASASVAALGAMTVLAMARRPWLMKLLSSRTCWPGLPASPEYSECRRPILPKKRCNTCSAWRRIHSGHCYPRLLKLLRSSRLRRSPCPAWTVQCQESIPQNLPCQDPARFAIKALTGRALNEFERAAMLVGR